MMQNASCSSPPPTFSTSANSDNFDFDLDLLDNCQVPSLELPLPVLDQQQQQNHFSSAASCSSGYYSDYSSPSPAPFQVPSPSSTLSPIEASLNSPTMFSPMDHGPRSPRPKSTRITSADTPLTPPTPLHAGPCARRPPTRPRPPLPCKTLWPSSTTSRAK